MNKNIMIENICMIDDMIWDCGDERVAESWLMGGPPDGMIEEFRDSKNKESELYYCIEDDYEEWLECGIRILDFMLEYKEEYLDSKLEKRVKEVKEKVTEK